jgi:crotonobetaine/carnitine-CoA ligase
MAALVPAGDTALDFDEIVEFCRPRLAYFAIPRFFFVCRELPLTENGKVRKSVLREWGVARADWDREANGDRSRSK